MRPVIGALATATLLGLTACTTGGTPAPSSVTVSPTLHWATPATSDPGGQRTATRRPRPSGRTPQAPGSAVLLTPGAVGPLALGEATLADATRLLDGRLGTPKSRSTCGGAAKDLTWGALTVTFAGVPERARAWEVDVEEATASLRLPRGTEWAPELEALSSRDDVTVTASGGDTVVTLAEGFRYRFGKDDRRARTVGAGTPVCG